MQTRSTFALIGRGMIGVRRDEIISGMLEYIAEHDVVNFAEFADYVSDNQKSWMQVLTAKDGVCLVMVMECINANRRKNGLDVCDCNLDSFEGSKCSNV